MQTEVPTLPVVHFNAPKNNSRKQNSNLGRASVEAKTNSAHKNIISLSSKKKILHPLLGRPYQSNVRQCPSTEKLTTSKNTLEQRVLSAKMLRIKELQNQLADAHYRLNELASENKLLKSLQKRQDSALKRYEGTNAELPRIINSHHEELRVLQIKYKKLKSLQKETCDLLKEKENELQHLQTQNKHLLQLSKDRNLGEREKLQVQVSDLNHRIQQQQDTIQILHRKLVLQTKSLKQQLHIEISKRKEVQKHLFDAKEKLKVLENFLDNRERRLYYNGQLVFTDKSRRFGTQSLTNLRDINSSNQLKLTEKGKKSHSDDPDNNSTIINVSELNNRNIKGGERINSNLTLGESKTETMTNLEQIRKYRLQKSEHRKVLLENTEDLEQKSNELELSDIDKNLEISVDLENLKQLEIQEEYSQRFDTNTGDYKRVYRNKKYKNLHALPKDKLIYTSDGSETESEAYKDPSTNLHDHSNQLHTRLHSSADESSDSKALRSGFNYQDKIKVLLKERQNSYESDTEVESEDRRGSINSYLMSCQQNDDYVIPSAVCTNRNSCNCDKKHENLLNPLEYVSNGSQEYDKNARNKEYMQDNNNENDGRSSKFIVKNAASEYEDLKDPIKSLFKETAIERESSTRGEEVISPQIDLTDFKSDASHTNDGQLISTEYSFNTVTNLTKNMKTKPSVDFNVIDENVFYETNNLKGKSKLSKEASDNEQIDFTLNTPTDAATDIANTNNRESRMTCYNKEKLLASMKAIDNNENIEFSSEDYETQSPASRKQAQENRFIHLPIDIKKKKNIIKDIFDTDIIGSETVNSRNVDV